MESLETSVKKKKKIFTKYILNLISSEHNKKIKCYKIGYNPTTAVGQVLALPFTRFID